MKWMDSSPAGKHMSVQSMGAEAGGVLIHALACPACGNGELSPTVNEHWTLGGAEEPRRGALRCDTCGRSYRFDEGILDFLHAPDAQTRDELDANRKLLAADRSACDDDWLLGLPRSHSVQRPLCADHDEEADLEAMAAYAGTGRGRLLIDLGAGTCWTTARWAQRGFVSIAADISLEKFVGLQSAEVFMRHGAPHFNRVRFDMSGRWPFRDESLDVVVAMASVHHAQDIDACFAEVRRVLKPDGFVLIVEATRSVFVPERLSDFGELERQEYGMNEHSYSQRDFRTIARRAGLTFQVVAPGSLEKKLELVATRSGFGGRTAMKHRLAYLGAPLLRLPWLRRAIMGRAFVALNWLFGMGFVGVGHPRPKDAGS